MLVPPTVEVYMDVIQQAREALERVRGGLPPSAPWPPTAGEWSLLYAVVEAADAGHLIDARQLQALGDHSYPGAGPVALEYLPTELLWRVWVEGEATRMEATAADALAAAERKAT